MRFPTEGSSSNSLELLKIKLGILPGVILKFSREFLWIFRKLSIVSLEKQFNILTSTSIALVYTEINPVFFSRN